MRNPENLTSHPKNRVNDAESVMRNQLCRVSDAESVCFGGFGSTHINANYAIVP
jgi:hypothetical protein